MRKLFILSLALSGVFCAYSQSALDAYQFTQPDMKGTARFMSMGGAFGALGGDMSTLSQNPGGIGVYRSSELGFTVDFDIQNSVAESQDGFSSSDDQFKFLLNNVGYIGSISLNNDVMPFFNLGFTYNKAASFNRVYGGAMNLNNSMSNYIAGIANGNNLTEADVAYVEGEYDPYHPMDGGYVSPWIAILGYDSYIINPQGHDEDTHWSGLWGQNTSGLGYFKTLEKGSINEYNISFGGNIYDVLYWGMDFGIVDLDYRQQTYWGESLENATMVGNDTPNVTTSAEWDIYNYYIARGSGFNYKLGLILKPIQELRIGFAFHTPTWYSMKEEYYANTNYSYPDTDIRDGWAETNDGFTGYNEYKYSTPWKIIASIAGVIGNKFIVSADYEWNNYQGMQFKSYSYHDFWGDTTNDSYYYENNDIDTYYRSTNSIRIGAEYRVLPQLSLRAGYANVSSPVKSAVKDNKEDIYTAGTRLSYMFDNSTNYITCGAGYRFKKFYCDMAYVYKHRSSEWHAFSPDTANPSIESPQADITSDNHQIVVSMGFRF